MATASGADGAGEGADGTTEGPDQSVASRVEADGSDTPLPDDLDEWNELDAAERDRLTRWFAAAVGAGGKVILPVGRAVTPSWLSHPEGEAIWQVSAAVIVAIALQLLLPDQFRSVLFLPILQVLLLIGLLVATRTRITKKSRSARTFSLLMIAILTFANVIGAGRLIVAIVGHSVSLTAKELLVTGGSIWLTNVIVFALWYWEFDRGGPAKRASEPRTVTDFLFPQMTEPALSPPDWQPTFPDYLYLSFTNATAFSPTDVMPLSRWAKMLMLLQSLVSLTTVALVVARAVNILG